jgi:hypothetical protein
MSKAISVVVSLILPMILFQVAKVLARGIRSPNSASSITAGLRLIGFGDMQTGIVVMMLLALITYIASMQILSARDRDQS